jgi:hypothetical protein
MLTKELILIATRLIATLMPTPMLIAHPILTPILTRLPESTALALWALGSVQQAQVPLAPLLVLRWVAPSEVRLAL